jgi:hypothetical protein
MKKFNLFTLSLKTALLCICLLEITGCTRFKDSSANNSKHPILLMAQRPTPEGYPAVLIKNIDYIESQPFDGMFLNSVSGWNLMNGQSVSYDSIYSEFRMLKGAFKKFKYNFLYVFINYPGDFWNDSVWTITSANFANMAKVAKELGCKGIIYDNEEYRPKKWLDYSEKYRNPKYDLLQHRDQAILRGKQLMEAMVAVFPDIEVMSYHGPYLSEPNYRIPNIVMGQADKWDHYEMLGPFFVGMMLGKGEKATIIDGGELYQYRTEKDFTYSYNCRKFEIASEETNSWFIPVKLRRTWPNDINVAFGVYYVEWLKQYPMNYEIMKTTLKNALKTTDKYVWYYTEPESWLTPGKMPHKWADLIREVRKSVEI